MNKYINILSQTYMFAYLTMYCIRVYTRISYNIAMYSYVPLIELQYKNIMFALFAHVIL